MISSCPMAVKRAFLLDAVWPALLAFLLYLPSVDGAPIWDDHNLLMNNTRVADMTVREAFTTDFWGRQNLPDGRHVLHYRPLALLAYTAVFRTFGTDPVVVHLADVLLHSLATFAFSCLLSGLAFKRGICGAAAFLFAVHPVHVEAVSWMSGMSETLAAAAILSCLALYVYGKLGWSFLFAAAAMLMKESAAVIPVLIFLLEGWRSWRPSAAPCWRTAARAAASYVPLAIAYLVARSLVLPPLPSAQFQKLFHAGWPFLPAVFGRYVSLLFFPWPMAFCYDLHDWTIPLLGMGIVAAW